MHWFRALSTLVLAACVFARAALPCHLLAETVPVLGVPLSVDEVVRVDQFTVRVRIGTEERLTSVDQLEETVMNLVFASSRAGSSMKAEALQTLIKNAVETQRARYAALALPFYLNAEELDLFEAEEFLEEIAKSQTATEAFKEALTSLRINSESLSIIQQREKLVVVMLFAIATSDTRWVRANALRWVFAVSDKFQEYVTEKFSAAALADNRLELSRLVSTVREVFGDDSEFYESLSVLRGRLEQVMAAKEAGEIEQLYPLVEVTRRDTLSGKVLYPILAERLQDEAARAIAAGNFDRALVVISRSDLVRRTPRTHALVLEALRKASPGPILVIRDLQVDEMLKLLAAADSEIRAAYVSYLQRQIDVLLSARDPWQVDAVLERMLAVRPDPNSLNDDIRISQSVLLLRANARTQALQKLSAVRTGISLFSRLRLGLAGLYVNRFVAILLLVVPLITGVWYLWVEVRRIRIERTTGMATASGGVASGREAARESSGGVKRVFTKGALRHEMDPREEEYVRCLQALGLPEDATLKKIKTTYRNLVKDIHPDVVQHEEGKASGKFIELTQAYDRALDLRRQLGLED